MTIAEAGPLAGLAGRQRQAAQRPAVEPAEEGDGVGAPGVVAGELERRLDRLGAGVAEEDTLRHAGRRASGRSRRQPLAEVGVGGR